MNEKRRLFIYDRKEVGVLILLGIGVALFAFTLGVHLGKQVVPKSEIAALDPGEKSAQTVEAAPAGAPNRTEIAEEVKNVPEAVDETLDQNLRDEVAKTGLQVEKRRALKLPEESRGEKIARGEVKPTEVHVAPAPKTRATATGRYVIQVGSFPSLEEAQPQILKLNEKGLRAEIRQVNLRGKGKWYRVFVGDYSSVAEAEKAGNTFRNEKRIGEFVVVNSPAPSQN